MLVGYARVSTQDQNLDLQRDALDRAGCEKTFTDVISGTQAERTGLTEALAYCREGDMLVVWKLDRLGRPLQHLIETVQELQRRGVGFKSLQESINTTTSGGKLIFHVFGALAEFERGIIRDRTMAELTSSRTRGRTGGRPRAYDSFAGGDGMYVASGSKALCQGDMRDLAYLRSDLLPLYQFGKRK